MKEFNIYTAMNTLLCSLPTLKKQHSNLCFSLDSLNTVEDM